MTILRFVIVRRDDLVRVIVSFHRGGGDDGFPQRLSIRMPRHPSRIGGGRG